MSNIDYRPDLDEEGNPLSPSAKDKNPYFYISPETLAKLGQRAMDQIATAEKDHRYPAC
jgi:hypothetical protein